jgi:hypothetical protein
VSFGCWLVVVCLLVLVSSAINSPRATRIDGNRRFGVHDERRASISIIRFLGLFCVDE